MVLGLVGGLALGSFWVLILWSVRALVFGSSWPEGWRRAGGGGGFGLGLANTLKVFMGGLGGEEDEVAGNLVELGVVWVQTTPAFLKWTPRTVPTSMPREYGTWSLMPTRGLSAPSHPLWGGGGGGDLVPWVAFVAGRGLGGGSFLRGGGHLKSHLASNALWGFCCP